jgi:hypothetical protein
MRLQKIVLNIAKSIFVKINIIALTVEKSNPKLVNF